MDRTRAGAAMVAVLLGVSACSAGAAPPPASPANGSGTPSAGSSSNTGPTADGPGATGQAAGSTDQDTAPPALVTLDPSVTDDTIARAVVEVVDRYFSGVNEGRYSDAYRAYSPRMRARHPFGEWRSGVSGSHDSQVVVSSVDAPDGLDGPMSADVTFTSRQPADLGPDGLECADWSLTYRLLPDRSGTGLLVDGASGSYTECLDADDSGEPDDTASEPDAEPSTDPVEPPVTEPPPPVEAPAEQEPEQVQVLVPSVVGLWWDAADEVAASAGLRLSVGPSGIDYGNRLSNWSAHRCIVVSQLPRAGTAVRPGSHISATGQCSWPDG